MPEFNQPSRTTAKVVYEGADASADSARNTVWEAKARRLQILPQTCAKRRRNLLRIS